MKKIRYIAAMAMMAVIMVAMSGCRKWSDNGKLDGQWQIMSIENVATGDVSVPVPTHYYCMNLHVVNLTPAINNDIITGNMHYDKNASTVAMDFPYCKTPEQIAQLNRWGIYSNEVSFNILELDGKKLVLRSSDSVITFRRF